MKVFLLAIGLLVLLTVKLASENLFGLTMLSDPFLQLPTLTTVNVVWFTEFKGIEHYVLYGEQLSNRVEAKTTKLSKVAEDSKSHLNQDYPEVTPRDVWRHEAVVTGLSWGRRVPYQVVSKNLTEEISSRVFTLAPKPPIDENVKILLTSDHQLMPMIAANLEKVKEVAGDLDGIFLAGDLVNVPDRASQWFDDQRGGAFFPCLQGRANYNLEGHIYRGGELIQHIPLFTAIGNHEVMGKFSREIELNQQFDNSYPRQMAENIYQIIAGTINPNNDPEIKANWLKNNSYNTDTYEEIFTLPENSPGGKKYYSLSFGNIWLGVLYVTNMWRSPDLSPEVRGRYQERTSDLNNPAAWGYGQHIFESIETGSTQYLWLEQELQTEAFTKAKYKIIMFHHPPHTLGGNIVPPYTEPLPQKHYDDQGKLIKISYDYLQENDYIIRDLIPLLEEAGVNLVFYGHSHLWNRFYGSKTKMNFLESSNVGNSYGAHWGDSQERSPYNYLTPKEAKGDPNGLEPILPSLAPLSDDSGTFLPYIASNEITVFSILDTATGNITSYRFNTKDPYSPVIKFDEFNLNQYSSGST
jgi:hypothetical protein